MASTQHLLLAFVIYWEPTVSPGVLQRSGIYSPNTLPYIRGFRWVGKRGSFAFLFFFFMLLVGFMSPAMGPELGLSSESVGVLSTWLPVNSVCSCFQVPFLKEARHWNGACPSEATSWGAEPILSFGPAHVGCCPYCFITRRQIISLERRMKASIY